MIQAIKSLEQTMPAFREGIRQTGCCQKLRNLINSIKDAVLRFFQSILRCFLPCLFKKKEPSPNTTQVVTTVPSGPVQKTIQATQPALTTQQTTQAVVDPAAQQTTQAVVDPAAQQTQAAAQQTTQAVVDPAAQQTQVVVDPAAQQTQAAAQQTQAVVDPAAQPVDPAMAAAQPQPPQATEEAQKQIQPAAEQSGGWWAWLFGSERSADAPAPQTQATVEAAAAPAPEAAAPAVAAAPVAPA